MDLLGPAVVSFGIPDNQTSEKPNAEKESIVQPAVAVLHDDQNKTLEELGNEKSLGKPAVESFDPAVGSLGPTAKENNNKSVKAMAR